MCCVVHSGGIIQPSICNWSRWWWGGGVRHGCTKIHQQSLCSCITMASMCCQGCMLGKTPNPDEMQACCTNMCGEKYACNRLHLSLWLTCCAQTLAMPHEITQAWHLTWINAMYMRVACGIHVLRTCHTHKESEPFLKDGQVARLGYVHECAQCLNVTPDTLLMCALLCYRNQSLPWWTMTRLAPCTS